MIFIVIMELLLTAVMSVKASVQHKPMLINLFKVR
jgi:hypothetical protein